MLRPFASITRQGSRVKGDILPGVGSAASGRSLTFPKKRAHKNESLPVFKFSAYGRRSVVKIYTGKCIDVTHQSS